jgi:hypothetical protein
MSVEYLDPVREDAEVQELMRSSKKPVCVSIFNVVVIAYLFPSFRYGRRTSVRRSDPTAP